MYAALCSRGRSWLVIVSALLVGVSLPARAADPSSLFYTENSGVFWMAAKDGYLYWYGPACGIELLPPTVFIRVSPPSVPAYAVFNPTGCPTTTMFSNTRIAIDDANIYWADGNHRIVQLPRSATPPTPATIFGYFSAVPSDVVDFAVDGTFVYWLEGRASSGRVVRTPKVAGGGSTLTWTAGASTNLDRLRIDPSGNAYALSGGTLMRLLPDPSSINFTARSVGASGLVSQYAVASDRIYWVESNASRQRLDVKSAPLTDPTQVAQHWTITTTGNTTVQDMTVDGANVYWIENQPGRTFAVMRLPRAGGPAVILASYGPNTADQPWQLVSIGGFLFWSLPNKAQIRRLAVDAPGLDLTSEGMGPMVVQVVQNQANDIPLIAGKATVVQAFGRIDPATTAQTSILLDPSATLAGVRAGVALPGSPIAPRSNFIELKSDAIDVRDVATSTAFSSGLTFDLPETWTHGTVTLTATLNPALTVPESNTTNNVASSTVTFQDPKSYCLQFVPIETETSTITGPSATITTFIDRAISVYPLIEFQTAFSGGPGLRRPRLPLGIVQGSDPWKLDNDFEMGYLLWTMWWAYQFNTGFACMGEGTTVLGPVAQARRFGMASPGVLEFLMQPGADAVAMPYQGLAGIAHELGHEFGRGHIGCPASGSDAPANPDGGYPHPSCFTDANTASAHVGYDSLSQRWMLPGSAADMMTYSSPLWISDYTYKAIARGLNLNVPLRAIRPPDPGADGPRSLIGGLLGAEPIIGYAFPVDAEQAQQAGRRLEGRASTSSELELRVRDSRGETLSREPLNLLRIESEGGPEASMFFNLVTLPPNAARIDVVAANGSTLVSRPAGPAAPRVTIEQPRKGAAIGSSLDIAWYASDPDNDPLLFNVRYSPDAGKTWQTLAANISERALKVPTAKLPGGRSALVEVTASDGLHAARAVAGPFEIARHAPELTIFDGSGRDVGPAAPATIAQSRPLVLRGYGYDIEDGQIVAGALQWRLSAGVATVTTGKELRVADVPPGRYQVSLEAQDSDGNHGRAEAPVTVLPKHVMDSPEAIVLDGRCNEMGYSRDDDPLHLRFADGAVVEARVVRAGNSLFACFAGLPPARSPADAVGLRVRSNSGAGDRLAERDLAFFVRRDGTAFSARGSSSGSWQVDTTPEGFGGAVSSSSRSWSAELKIDAARWGGWNREVHVQAVMSSADDETAWPRGSSSQHPGSWGAVILGRVPQSITFAAPTDVQNSPGFDLVATASSGLAVNYSTGGACTSEGRHLTVRGPGACTVVASQAGNGAYAPAAPVTRSFLVCPSAAGARDACPCKCKSTTAAK